MIQSLREVLESEGWRLVQEKPEALVKYYTGQMLATEDLKRYLDGIKERVTGEPAEYAAIRTIRLLRYRLGLADEEREADTLDEMDRREKCEDALD